MAIATIKCFEGCFPSLYCCPPCKMKTSKCREFRSREARNWPARSSEPGGKILMAVAKLTNNAQQQRRKRKDNTTFSLAMTWIFFEGYDCRSLLTFFLSSKTAFFNSRLYLKTIRRKTRRIMIDNALRWILITKRTTLRKTYIKRSRFLSPE